MTYLDTAVEGNSMDVVIIGVAHERSYYPGDYDPDNIVPPDCFALSLTGENMAADGDFAIHPTCSGCPNDEWGSGRGRGKACSERRRLVVAPAGVVEKGTMEGVELASIKIPVTSVKNWGTYVNKLRSGLSRPHWSVTTNIKVVPDAKTMFKIIFDLVDPITNSDLLGELRKANAEASVYTMQPFDMTPSDVEPAPESDKF